MAKKYRRDILPEATILGFVSLPLAWEDNRVGQVITGGVLSFMSPVW